MPVAKQANHRRNLNGLSGRVHFGVVGFLGLRHAFQHQDQGAPHGGNVDRLEGGVQNQHGSLHHRRAAGGQAWHCFATTGSGATRASPILGRGRKPNFGRLSMCAAFASLDRSLTYKMLAAPCWFLLVCLCVPWLWSPRATIRNHSCDRQSRNCAGSRALRALARMNLSVAPVVITSSTSRTRSLSTRGPLRVA